MPLLKRIGYYLGGFAIGLVILAFIWKKKDTQFCYSPNCRVLKDIRTKKLNLENISVNDTAVVQAILKKGDVIFSKSDTKSKPCRTYFIKNKEAEIQVKNCDSIAIVEKLSLN